MMITRNSAIAMHNALSRMALGHLSESLLEVTMGNISTLRKVADDYEMLKKELSKRIYGDMDAMSGEDKGELMEFFKKLQQLEAADNDIRAELDAQLRADYPEYYAMRTKEIKVLISLLNKPMEIELTAVDADAFCKGILQGNKTVNLTDVRSLFAPMFIQEETAQADLSELDELLLLNS